MKRKIVLLGAVMGVWMLFPGVNSVAARPQVPPPPAGRTGTVVTTPGQTSAGSVRISLDKTSLHNHGIIHLRGVAPEAEPVYVEVWSNRTVRTDYFDTKKDKKTGKTPYILYMTKQMPAYYTILIPVNKLAALKAVEALGKSWSCAKALKNCGALGVFKAPAAIPIDRYQVSLLGGIIGSRGAQLSAMSPGENALRAMQLIKTRFRSAGVVFAPDVTIKPDGSFSATIIVPPGAPDGAYRVRAAAGSQAVASNTVTFENHITLPYVYLTHAGSTMNLVWPFLLSFAVCTFGVLMGAGGGFILNPLLLLIWPLPPAVVAGTVMPTVLFSQASGIYNYSKIKFINWKLGIAIGAAMLLGGFIGPELTELITLSQFKFIFGIILIFLAALMAWQTTPSYVAKNKKEKAILQQFQKKAQEAAARKNAVARTA
ncbi:MAG: sulfite exporter TauE/SafE family protein [Syntrophobacteraceae bacterium]